MEDLTEIIFGLLGLLIVLALSAAIGHGIWVIARTILRALFGNDAPPVRVTPHCPGCGARVSDDDLYCNACGRWQGKRGSAELADLTAAARVLERLQRNGQLDPATYQRAAQAIEAAQLRLTQPAPAASPETAPPPYRPPQSEPVVVNEQPAPVAAFNATPSKPVFIQPEPQSAPEPTVAPPPEPRRSFGEMLATFMEESSIRWGELLGGLLIIGCSLALVISLWAEIAERPLLKFSIFLGMTAGLFGLGFYSAHRWRLPTTSRGVLITSTLLVPLNFLAIAAFTRAAVSADFLLGASELAAFVLCAVLVYFAGRVIAPEQPQLLVAGVLGPSLAMLLARHLGQASAGWLLLGVLPLVCYWLSAGAVLRRAREEIDADEAGQIFVVLGASAFAALLPIALLLVRTGHIAQALRTHAPLVNLFGVPALAVGLLLWRRVRAAELASLHTIGTSIGICGAVIMIASSAMAWPQAGALLIISIVNCAVFAALAYWYEFLAARAATFVYLLLAYLLGFQALRQSAAWQLANGGQLVRDLTSAASGAALIGLFVLLAGAAEWLWQRRENERAQRETLYFDLATLAVGALSLLLIAAHGFGRAGDPQQAAVIYGFYAIAVGWLAWRRAHTGGVWVSSALLLAALVQACAFKFGAALRQPWQLAFLLHASVTLVIAMLAQRRNARLRVFCGEPLAQTALFTSCLAAAALFVSAGTMTAAELAWRSGWLAAIWLLLAGLQRRAALFTAFQTALTISVVCAVRAALNRWQPSHWFDPAALQATGIVCALLGVGWIVVRLRLRTENKAERETETEAALWPALRGFLSGATPTFAFARLLAAAALVLLIWLGFFSAWEGVLDELVIGIGPNNADAMSNARAAGVGSWLLLAAVLLVLAVSLWERFNRRVVLAVIVAGACVCWLLAGLPAQTGTPASMLRWSLAVYLFAGSALLWRRGGLAQWCARFGWPQMRERSVGLSVVARRLLILLTAAPVLVLTLLGVLLTGNEYFKPSTSGSFFARTGLLVSYAAPLVIIGLAFAGHAVRERAASYACAAGLWLNGALTAGFLLRVWRNGDWQSAAAVQLLQLNLLVSACCSLVWLGVLHWWAQRQDAQFDSFVPQLLRAQTRIVLGIGLLFLVLADLRLLFDPAWPSSFVLAGGSVWNWLALGLSAAAFVWAQRRRAGRIERLAIGALALGSLLACSLHRFDHGQWLSYRALLTAFACTAWLLLLLGWLLARGGKLGERFVVPPSGGMLALVRKAELWAAGLGVLTIALALRAVDAPDGARHAVGTLIALSLLAAGLAVLAQRRFYLYAAGLLGNVALTIWAVKHSTGGGLLDLVLANVIALALPSLAWLWIELKMLRATPTKALLPPFHQCAALAALTTLTGVVFVSLLAGPMLMNARLSVLALVSLAALLCACLWDGQFKLRVAAFYVLGLTGLALLLDVRRLDAQPLATSGAVILALYAVAAGVLWRGRARVWALADQWRIPRAVENAEAELWWLAPANTLLALVTVMLSIGAGAIVPSLSRRLLVASAALLAAFAVGLLAQGRRRLPLQTAALAVGAAGAVAWGWAWLTPGAQWVWLHRLVMLMALTLGAALVCYNVWSAQLALWQSDWVRAIRRIAPALGVIGLSTLAWLLLAEVGNVLSWGEARLSWPAILTITGALISLALTCLAFALLPGRDPLNLAERGRMRYVYAAEGLLIILFVHVRLALPWLFSGRFRAWWPLVVMALAFAGVSLGEIFRRRGRLVLAEPLAKTGVILPVLPVLGFWAVHSEVSYSGVLLLVGLFYGVLSVMRQSFAMALLAVLAGNGGLWHYLHSSESYGFFEHPQLWLIPLALSVLTAARLNRERLSQEQMTALRYAALTMIYVSSTADIFIAGASGSPWLPVLLAVLSVAGVLAGLLMRVRAFLFLGTSFLLLALLTIVWHAATNFGWTWLWYVTGIAFGVLIIYLFALFERKREMMLGWMRELKQWQA